MNNYSTFGSFIVYSATNKLNGKKYIGITKRSLSERKKSHKYEAYHEQSHTYNSPFKRAIRKYGIDGFEWDILEENLTKEEALKKEQEYIKQFQTYYSYSNSNGYNATIGGENIAKPKDLISCFDPDSCDKVFEGTASEVMSFTNLKAYSQLYDCLNNKLLYMDGLLVFWNKDIENLSEAELKDLIRSKVNAVVQLDMNGNVLNYFSSQDLASRYLKISQGLISAVLNEQRYSTHGFIFMWYNDFRQGIKREREKRTKEIKIRGEDKDGNSIYFNSLTEAHNTLGVELSSLSMCLKGKRKTCGGYKWFYV